LWFLPSSLEMVETLACKQSVTKYWRYKSRKLQVIGHMVNVTFCLPPLKALTL
jgi:hypothetical protein